MLLNCGVGEDSWESLGLQGDPTSPFWRRSTVGVLWKNWCWSWISNTLATSWEELTRWKRPWCWEGLGAGGEGDNRGCDGWMASLTRWTWVWVNSRGWWWTGRPGMLRFMGSQRVRHDWATELNWADPKNSKQKFSFIRLQIIEMNKVSKHLLLNQMTALKLSFQISLVSCTQTSISSLLYIHIIYVSLCVLLLINFFFIINICYPFKYKKFQLLNHSLNVGTILSQYSIS